LVGLDVIISRTGYTGEDGFEITLIASKNDLQEKATKLWEALLDAGKEFDIKPCGLGARDSLRLGGGLPLSGQDFSELYDPFEMDLAIEGIFIDLSKDFFIGQEALKKKYPTTDENGRRTLKELKRKRVGLELLKRGIPRHGTPILHNGVQIGQCSSGGYSPLLKKGIAMAILPIEYTELGTELEVKIRDKVIPAKVVKYPFFDTEKYGRKRKQ
jgi:aminomethyltransferase